MFHFYILLETISDVINNIFKNMNKNQPPVIQWREFVCGWGAACINITVTYPVNKIIFRQMLHNVKVYEAFKQLRNEGIYYLYRGMLPPLCQKTLSLSLMFGVYEEVRRPLTNNTEMNPYCIKAVAGLVAGSTEAILMPFERIQTLLADSTYHRHFKNTFDAFAVVGTNYGFREYYRGLVPILLRNGPSNVCFFIMRDEIQLRLQKSDSVIKQTFREFICGAIIGVTLSSIFFPLNVLKIAMQSQLGGDYQNIYQVFKKVYNERGGRITSFYYGVHANVTRAFFSWGLINAAYEHLKEIVYSF